MGLVRHVRPAARWAVIALITGIGFLDVTAAAGSASVGVVQGTVLRVNGDPIDYANVVILGTRLGVQSAEDGRFRITGVPPGRWQLQVHAAGFPRTIYRIDLAAGDTLRMTLRIPASQEDRGVLIRDNLRSIGRWPPTLDATLEARMRDARDVRVLRLDPGRVRHPAPADTTRFVGPWPIVGEVRRPRPWLDSLLAAVQRADYVSRTLGGIKPCGGFEPGICVRYAGDSPVTELLLCYKCGEFAIRSRDGIAQAGDFDGEGPGFVRFAKAMFPLDPAIQALGRPHPED
jgi:hypothetical protein